MENRISFYQHMSGIGTGIVITTFSSLMLWETPKFWESIVWQCMILIALFILSSSKNNSSKSGNIIELKGVDRLAFWAILPLVFMTGWRVSVDIYFIYTVIWIAYAPFYMSWKSCWYWLAIISIGWYLIRLYAWGESQPLAGTLLVGTFHVFALLSARTAQEAQQANEKTQELNRELLATQHLLSETSRERERIRIARDLHDLLGHHLTALTINLQVASHLSDGEAKEKVDQCHSLSKLLLSDVRETVATMRKMPVVKLQELLEIAIKDIPRLQISLDVEAELEVDDVNTAEVLLRIIQEAITNTLKHSHARAAKIKVKLEGDQIIMEYTDDGGGCEKLKHGHGLQGMRERIERLDGQLHIESKPNFSIRAIAPLAN
jgi:signal transduction histidine kinase